jgi:hypothetical protein
VRRFRGVIVSAFWTARIAAPRSVIPSNAVVCHQTSPGSAIARRATSCACHRRALAGSDAISWLRLSSCLYIRSLARRRSDFFDFLVMCIPHTTQSTSVRYSMLGDGAVTKKSGEIANARCRLICPELAVRLIESLFRNHPIPSPPWPRQADAGQPAGRGPRPLAHTVRP